MKKYIANICLLIFCILVSGRQCYAQNLAGQTIEAVLLIDTSKSMWKCKDKLKDWSEDFCYNCAGKNIILSYVTFDNAGNEKKIITKTKIDESNYKECVSKIRNAAIEGLDTDQLGAFKYAEKILENSNADIKYIIMLSDGKIDYSHFDKKDENGKVLDEESAGCALKSSCKEFTGKNQRVILVGFGNNVKLFKEIKDEDDKEDREQLRIRYINSDRDPSDVIEEFLTGTGNFKKELNKDKEEKEEEGELRNSITFRLPKDYDLADVYIEKPSDNRADLEKKVSVYCGSKEFEKDKQIIQQGENYLKIKLMPAREGEYTVKLPEKRKWGYKVLCWYTRIKEVKLKLLSDDEEIDASDNKDGLTLYEPGIFQGDLKLKAELSIDEEAEENQIKVKQVYYLNIGENDDNIEELWNDKSKRNEMTKNINLVWKCRLDGTPDENNNIYQARVYLSDGSHIDSNKIKIVPKNEEILEYSLDAIVEKKCDLVSLIPEDYKKYVDEMKFTIDGDVLGNIDNENYISENNGKIITFKEKGEYNVDIQNRDNDIFAKVVINVKENPSSGPIFLIIVIVVIFAVIAFGLIIIKKKN